MVIEDIDRLTPKSGVIFSKHGIFNIDKIYSEIKDWYSKRQYEFVEKDYNIKERTRGNEVRLKLDGERDINEFTRFVVKIEFYAIDVIPVEYEEKNMQKGDLEVRFISYIQFDHKEKWTGPIGGFLKHLYLNYLLKDKVNNILEVKLSKENAELKKIIKDNLDLYN